MAEVVRASALAPRKPLGQLHRSRKLPIRARLRPLLEPMSKRKRPWFFTAGPGRKYPAGDHWINPKRLDESFLKLVKSLKMPTGRDGAGFTIHSLRHFFETFCTNNGIPQRVVDTWLGRTGDPSMGANYYKLSDEESQSFMLKVPFGTGESAADAGNPQT